MFPISRDPPEGGTRFQNGQTVVVEIWFPISRDPPEGGTHRVDEPIAQDGDRVSNF